MKKKLAPFILGIGLVSLAACSNDSSESNESEENTDQGEVEYGDVLASSKAGDITTDDVLNQIGTNQVANQTFQLVLDQILSDKYSEEIDREELTAHSMKEDRKMTKIYTSAHFLSVILLFQTRKHYLNRIQK